jgi:hippurate hydrolase
MLIVQPAEERISGASAMMRDGLYERIAKPDYALAFHVESEAQAGKVLFPLGVVASSADSVDIRVRGVGTHGAYPHMGVDPVLVASQIVVSLQSLVSRTLPPLEPGVITVGAIHGGSKHNIVGDHVDLQLTVRSDSPEARTMLLDGIDRVARGVAVSLNVPDDLMPEVRRSNTESTPPTINNRELVVRLGEAVSGLMDVEVADFDRTGMGAEDFSFFVQPETDVPGMYFIVGGTAPENLENPTPHHSPFFRIEPEPSIRAGVEASVLAAMALMPPVDKRLVTQVGAIGLAIFRPHLWHYTRSWKFLWTRKIPYALCERLSVYCLSCLCLWPACHPASGISRL